ncbi:response regulator transcription factor [Neobacillus sp. PS3-40]|uniref:response regulator transcription factor n=1 Tax=Neobacillus sp. PS3-40 TaxID=3070679 RepID=UPI0027DFC384|nr:response regulator transcription factor [Neobacillus sp. PS3-40]WML43100.1 response regulator transcription factor [Neobacillus sp. PS3-40]
MRNKVLVVDDEQSIVTLLQYNFKQAGFEVVTALNGEVGRDLAITKSFDIIVLDLMLPKLDGMEVCKQLRQRNIMTPILMLTAKDDEFDKVLGLELGADDYMVKPFSPREVIARVKAILRRTQPQINEEEKNTIDIKIGELKIELEQYKAYFQDKQLELTLTEFELLLFLAKNKDRMLTRDQLLNAVWNFEFAGDSRIVDVFISHLREKIEIDSKKPRYIKTIRGLGYKLEEPSNE